MDQIKQHITSAPMLSKIGKHISQRISGSNRHHDRTHQLSFPSQSRLKKSSPSPRSESHSLLHTHHHHPHPSYHKTSPSSSPLKLTYSMTVQRIKKMKNNEFKPCVGHYKVKYNIIDKNHQKINFKKLLPHFARDKPSSNHTQTQYNDTPTQPPRVTGMKEFDRMTSREDIKGSIRKQGENPHEKRFELTSENYWSTPGKLKNTISFQKMLKRKGEIFKVKECSPDYDVNCEFGKKRLALSVIPFERQVGRGGLWEGEGGGKGSELRDPVEMGSVAEGGGIVGFDGVMGRYRQDVLPSYLDGGINTRGALNEKNWKTLKMNCWEGKQERERS